MTGMEQGSRAVTDIRRQLSGLRDLPREQARMMSPAYYTSADFLELEKEIAI